MEFTKMQGIGNDFILINAFERDIPDPAALARRLCDRHFGVGGDGLILAAPSPIADARMRIFNRDGSEPEMCGNGIRCLARFLYEKGLCIKTRMRIETGAGVLSLEVTPGGDFAVSVNMGRPILDAPRIPVDAPGNRVRLEVQGRTLDFFCASMGNPHAVTFSLWPEEAEFLSLGQALERHPVFPRRANIEFCRVTGPDAIEVRVWERGDGPTLACGTGACASAVAGASLGLTGRHCAVRLPGGALDIHWRDEGVIMTGPARRVFEGTVEE